MNTRPGGCGAKLPRRPVPRARQPCLALFPREQNGLREYLPGPNREPWEALREVAAGQRCGSLHLWGETGTGKSHLLRALCLEYPPGAARWLEEIREPLEDRPECPLTCVDNLERLAGHRPAEQTLLALYDAIRTRGGTLLTASGEALRELPLALPDLRSRLCWGLVFRLRPLSDPELEEVLRRRAYGRGLHLPEEGARYLLQRAPRDLSTLCVLLDRLEGTAGRRLSIPFLRTQLAAAGFS